jgi:hypothetical protein
MVVVATVIGDWWWCGHCHSFKNCPNEQEESAIYIFLTSMLAASCFRKIWRKGRYTDFYVKVTKHVSIMKYKDTQRLYDINEKRGLSQKLKYQSSIERCKVAITLEFHNCALLYPSWTVDPSGSGSRTPCDTIQFCIKK